MFLMLNSTEHKTYHAHKFISMLNTSMDSLKARKIFTFQHICLYELLKFYAQLSVKKVL